MWLLYEFYFKYTHLTTAYTEQNIVPIGIDSGSLDLQASAPNNSYLVIHLHSPRLLLTNDA